MLIAVSGDVHGQFLDLAVALEDACAAAGVNVADIAGVLCAGDVEALRSDEEMAQVHGPARYRKRGDFAAVLDGSLPLPPLAFIGGNHEPWEALDADGGLSGGGGAWAPGATFLGRAGVVEVFGLRVAFLSGIYSPAVSEGSPRGRTDRRRRTYWVRSELERVMHARAGGPVDVLLTHDWPAGVGIDRRGEPVGCPHVRRLVETVKPTLSAHGHMHHALSGRIGASTVLCLGHVSAGFAGGAVALLSREPGGTLHRIG